VASAPKGPSSVRRNNVASKKKSAKSLKKGKKISATKPLIAWGGPTMQKH